MRRKDREISRDEAIGILEKGEYGVLSMCTPTNEGYGVPLNYVLFDNSLYFHCATAGSKLESLNENGKVSFCVVGATTLLPAEFGTLYESVIVAGSISRVEGKAKTEALKELVKKYSGEFIPQGNDYIDRLIDKVIVLKLPMESVTGKARKR